jgi:hypothetical protein
MICFQLQTIEPKLGRKKLKKLKKAEREKTKGDDWFHMKAPEMTPELQNELDVLKMRSAIDPTRFYKKADSAAPPKYFQVCRISSFHLATRSQSYDFLIYSYSASVVGSRLERFSKWNQIFFFRNKLGYPWRCKKLQRWGCKSKS